MSISRQDVAPKMWTLFIDDDENNRTTVKLASAEYTIGRAAGSAICLSERNISRTHAKLSQTPAGRWTLTDLDSDNGCFVNGRRITDVATPLAHGDFIQLGDYRLRLSDNDIVRTNPELEDDTLRAVPHGVSIDNDRLIVVSGPNPGAVYPLHGGSILIGRGEECQIALGDTSVSRVHAEVVGTATGYELIDRGSSHGLHINGISLTRTFLQPRDVIEIGDIFLKFVPKGEVFVSGESTSLPPHWAAEVDTPLAPTVHTIPTRTRIATVGSGLLLLILVAAFAVLKERREVIEPVAVITPKKLSAAELIVREAKRLQQEGNLTRAHEKLQEIPSDSNLRQAAEVIAIEQAWADTIFEMVASESDVANKRALLTSIAATEGVSGAQRKRAAAQLQTLEAPSLDVTQLPVEEPSAVAVKAPSPRKIQRPAPSSASTTAANPSPKSKTPEPEPASELIRKAPF
ncbi:MAG TPA: FHA domain-containing protein [Polyangiaceae bacterium]|nr:FHA domain-containing protein [Polyangiaceae bacterium]